MIIEEVLQTFLKSKPLRMQLLKGNGHENRGMAADIPKKSAYKAVAIERERP